MNSHLEPEDDDDVHLRDLFEPMTRGDELAWDRFLRLYLHHLLSAVRFRLRHTSLRSRPDSFEVCQSVLLGFVEGVNGGTIQVDTRPRLIGLLTKMVHRKIGEYERRDAASKRDRRRLVDSPVEDLDLASPDSDPGRTAAVEELYAIFQATLTADEASVIAKQSEGGDWSEIAEALGSSRDAVRMRAHRLVARLEALLDRE